MKIGIIGAGQIGSALIRQYAKAGHEIKITNSSNLEKLQALEKETGAKAVQVNEVAIDSDVLVIAIPLCEIPNLAKSLSNRIADSTIIIDTTNYYPIRDGRIDALDNGMPESVWVSNQLSLPVIKVYNSILAGSLINKGHTEAAIQRIALPISGDNKQSKAVVATLVNDSGYDALDIGQLADSWRQQPGSPIYCTDLTRSELKLNASRAIKQQLPDNRELALQWILKQDPSKWLAWYNNCVANNRLVYKTIINQ
ncbi:MAG: NAD(P)-binding domain-containing protein [Bacteroidota bacterium]